MTRSIAVLGGTGPEGFGLARRWAKAGEKIIIGSRDAKRARAAAEKITASIEDAQVSGDENIVACAAADLVVLTIPFEGHAPLLKQIKPVIRPDAIVVDATVPLAASVGGRARLQKRSRLPSRMRRSLEMKTALPVLQPI